MEKINTPEALPNCKIINTLIEKANCKTDFEFEYIYELEKVRTIISIEVSRINLLFPEYTPHDEKYHLRRLFFVADQMLGDTLIQSMNATELFLLALCLYAHDWGMAISEEERECILSGTPSNSITLLENENSRLKEFCKNRNIDAEKIEPNEWQEYVRVTHAFRSGKRIKSYFESISPGIAEFSSRICEGHWLDFDIIDDYISYPTDASIHRDIVNIKALTIYVRLTDLLDLGEDRTPYVLWKFVAPRNKFSKLEWSKHRALQPVTFPQYQQTRYIQVEGSTDDQNVFMSVMDLKRYVDDQFRHCLDILNRINHVYHKLNISHIHWRIAPRGFEPVAIQFEFDRNRMFEILGDEIYQGNPYVFVRELLQNAIDAIEIRTELLEKRDLIFKPKINLEVNEDEEFYVVKIVDNGIGMDEYIIRNYLAVAGKSYYQSIDFQKEGLKMDPISRFGIGVLSCFMVADCIEIETFKDPNTTQKQEHLKITIPSKENYFQIKKNVGLFDIGTSFKIFVLKTKLPKDKKSGKIICLKVTEYLQRVAGFVKYPISIKENNSENIITNPNVNLIGNPPVLKLNYRFPIEDAFAPQHIENVKDYFVEKRYHLKTDLNLDDFDGCLTYFLPKNDNIDIANAENSWPMSEIKICDFKTEIKDHKKVKWNEEWSGFYPYYKEKEEKTSFPKTCYKVFMNGILIKDITPPSIEIEQDRSTDSRRRYSTLFGTFVNPQLIVNISRPVGMKIDLARTRIETKEKWDNPIWKSFFKHLKATLIEEIIQKNPKQRLLSIARLVTFYRLSNDIIINELIDCRKFPIPFISAGQELTFKEFDKVSLPLIKLAPAEFAEEFSKRLEAEYVEYKTYQGVLNRWTGSAAMVNFKGIGYLEKGISSLNNMSGLLKFFINQQYFMSSIEFITSPLGKNFPLVQEIFEIKPTRETLGKFDLTKRFQFQELDNYDCSLLRKIISETFDRFPIVVKFPSPYTSKIFYGFKYINIDNILIKSIIKICLFLIENDDNDRLTPESRGELFDLVYDLPFTNSYYSDEEILISDLNSKFVTLFSIASNHGIVENDHINTKSIISDDFIENSILVNQKNQSFKLEYKNEKLIGGKNKWGRVLE